MKAVVVHESLFGNTQRVAEAVAAALGQAYEVTLLRAVDARPEQLAGADLLVLGAPTHGHGLSRPASRAGTAKQGVATEVANGPGIRELIPQIPATRGAAAAAFDTRFGWPVWLTGAASRRIARALRGSGYRMVVPPESFIVTKAQGPLRTGEVERASEWGARIALHTGASRPASAREPALHA